MKKTSELCRLLNLGASAAYLSVSYWTMRSWVEAGDVPTVRLPRPRARDGRTIRRVLIDRADLDRMIEQAKTGDTHL